MTDTLAIKNAHERDVNIRFYNKGHKYEIATDKDSKYTSVTTLNHSYFPKFDADAIIQNIFNSKSWGPDNKYWGMTAEQIKASWKANGDAVSGAGTNLHERIEKFMNSYEHDNKYTHEDLLNEYEQHLYNGVYYADSMDMEKAMKEQKVEDKVEDKEWNYFIQFITDYPDMVPYRTEWMIYDEDSKVAGSIDMVYENSDGTLSIYDWKRCKEIVKQNTWNKFALEPLIKHIPDTNFWHYSLQLNTYKYILERKYGKTIRDLYLVRLHPTNNSYELIEVPIMTKEIVELFQKRTGK